MNEPQDLCVWQGSVYRHMTTIIDTLKHGGNVHITSTWMRRPYLRNIFKVYFTTAKEYSPRRFSSPELALDFCRSSGRDAKIISHSGHPVGWFMTVEGEECWGMHEVIHG